MSPHVDLRFDGPVARLTLTRAEKLNGFRILYRRHDGP